MRIGHCVALSFATITVGLVGCSNIVSWSFGNYYDQIVATEQKCNPGAVIDTSSKSNFQALCGAFGQAPGASDVAGQIDACVSQLSKASCGATINCKVAGTLPDGSACGNQVQC